MQKRDKSLSPFVLGGPKIAEIYSWFPAHVLEVNVSDIVSDKVQIS